jgi:hypothetical protein
VQEGDQLVDYLNITKMILSIYRLGKLSSLISKEKIFDLK